MKKLTTRFYQSLKQVIDSAGKRLIVYTDAKTGLLGILSETLEVRTAPKYRSIQPILEVFPKDYSDGNIPAGFVFTTDQEFGYMSQTGPELFHTKLLTKSPEVSYLPMKLDSFAAFTELMSYDTLQLVDFGKPYEKKAAADAEKQFFANLALAFDLPKDSTEKEVMRQLIAKKIIAERGQSPDFTYDDFFAVAYYIQTGTTALTLSKDQLWSWGKQNSLYFERGPHDQVGVDDFNWLLLSKALFKAKNPTYKMRPLQADQLTDAERSMLLSLLQPNGVKSENVRLPLPASIASAHLPKLVSDYNKAAPQLLQDYLKQ